MSTMIQDALHHKTVLKVEDEDFIFIRRAVSNKKKKPKLERSKEIIESDTQFLSHMQAQMETEESQESKNRQKIIFKKLLFLNTKRLLEILKFKPGESERKKL